MIEKMPVYEVVDRIENLNQGLSEFWKDAKGWAPVKAAGLLNKSRLDWQVSLSRSLRHWVRNSPESLEDGELILAWVNLGSLIEGTLKLFLSVYYEDYRDDIDGLMAANIYKKNKSQALMSPDGLTMEPLKVYFKKKKFLDSGSYDFIELVQKRRNAVHAFKTRPIGNDEEFQSSLRDYLRMLRLVNHRLPYPDDIYIPRET